MSKKLSLIVVVVLSVISMVGAFDIIIPSRGTACENACNHQRNKAIAQCASGPEGDACRQAANEAWDACMEKCHGE